MKQERGVSDGDPIKLHRERSSVVAALHGAGPAADGPEPDILLKRQVTVIQVYFLRERASP